MILDIVCGVILVVFGLIGYFRGFARQIFGLLSGFVALIGAYILLAPVCNLLIDLVFAPMFGETGILATVTAILEGSALTPELLQEQNFKILLSVIISYVLIFIVYALLALLVGLVWKGLKSLVHPICDLRGIRVVDKILGVVLGLVWGVLLVVTVLYVLHLASGWKIVPEGISSAITNLIDSLSDGPFVVKPFIIDYFDKIETFFAETWRIITAGGKFLKSVS